MALSFIEKFKQRKQQKLNEVKEIARTEKLKESCKEKFEAFKIKTTASQSKIGTIEESFEEKEGLTTKTIIVYTAHGPVTKKEVHTEKIKDEKKYVDDYTIYEGYIAPEGNINEVNGIILNNQKKSGYFEITQRTHYLANPVERETTAIISYEGANQDYKGNVTIINETEVNGQSSSEYDYGSVIKKFESIIDKTQKKLIDNELSK